MVQKKRIWIYNCSTLGRASIGWWNMSLRTLSCDMLVANG
jgi:hypothetical protein